MKSETIVRVELGPSFIHIFQKIRKRKLFLNWWWQFMIIKFIVIPINILKSIAYQSLQCFF